MSWYRIDDAFLDHPKMQQLERAGARMWADGTALFLALALLAARSKDESVPMQRAYRATPLGRRRAAEVLKKLEDVGLIRIDGDMVLPGKQEEP